ncbi:MAG: response regulator [Casimicrobiaceae bacterium]
MLVVDDEDALLRVLALVLEDEGYRVITARNGRMALDACRSEVADVVVTDYMMPEMTGNDFIAALHAERPRVPVIVMSSLDEDVVARACKGHARFFRKPFDVPEFLRSIAHIAESASRDRLRLVK